MIVAVCAVWVVQVPAHQVIDVIAVRDRLVAASRSVRVRRIVRAAGVLRRASGRVLGVDGDRALVDVPVVLFVQMAVVRVAHVIAVTNSDVPAPGAVNVVVVCMHLMTHDLPTSQHFNEC